MVVSKRLMEMRTFFPYLARLAEEVAALASTAGSATGGHNQGPSLDGRAPLTSAEVRTAVERTSTEAWRDRAFYRLLNRMLFGAGRPDLRYRVLERFYGMPEPLIRRFYRGRLTWADRGRLLAGKPPVPVVGAMRVLTESGFKAVRDAA